MFSTIWPIRTFRSSLDSSVTGGSASERELIVPLTAWILSDVPPISSLLREIAERTAARFRAATAFCSAVVVSSCGARVAAIVPRASSSFSAWGTSIITVWPFRPPMPGRLIARVLTSTCVLIIVFFSCLRIVGLTDSFLIPLVKHTWRSQSRGKWQKTQFSMFPLFGRLNREVRTGSQKQF